MLRHRSNALLLLVTLLAALLPAAAGEGCRLCGKVGRCCCFAHPAAAKPHCAGMSGSQAACSMQRSAARPAAFRAPQSAPERMAGFAALALPSSPESSGSIGETPFRRPAPIHHAVLTPPPRALRLV
jgi:hypothetical protein